MSHESEPAAALHEEVADLRLRLEQNDAEIDALQVAAARGEERAARPWYREGALLTAVIALLFSFGTTVVSYVRLDQEAQHDARNELTGYLQRLSELPRLEQEVLLEHGQSAGSQLLAFVGAERELIANQARSVMQLIPDQVLTVEYVTVGFALQNIGAFSQAQEVYRQSLEVARNPLDRVVALRSLAGIRFLLGDVDGGRELYAEARDVYSKEIDAPELVVAYVNAETELQWALTELGAGQCAEAESHIAAAEALLVGQPIAPAYSPRIAQLRAQHAACQAGQGPLEVPQSSAP